MKEKKLKLFISLIAISTIGLLFVQFYWIYSILRLENERLNKNLSEAINNTVLDIEKYETEKQVIKIIAKKTNADNFVYHANTITNSGYLHKEKHEKINKKQKTTVDIKIDNSFNFSNKNGSMIVLNNDTIINLTSKGKQIDSIINKKKKIIDKVFENVFVFDFNLKFEDRIPFKTVDSLIKANLNKKGISNEYCFGIINNPSDSVVYKTKNCDKNELINAKYKLPVFQNPFDKNTNYLSVFVKDDYLYFIKKIGLILLFSVLFLTLNIYVFYKTIKSYFLQKKISELKTDLINNVTHEFKTPIASIGLAGEMIKSFNINEQAKYLDIIAQENDRLKGMVESLLNGAKLEHGGFKISVERTNVVLEINKIIEKYRVLAEQIGGKISVEYSDDLISINTDLFCLSNIINNLVDNSIKYCSVTPEIKIAVFDSDREIKITIQDNGYGIEKKYLKEIFEPFFRVPTGNIYKGKGYGLGLSYVKKSVEALGGKISVESELRKGTCFTIILPKL